MVAEVEGASGIVGQGSLGAELTSLGVRPILRGRSRAPGSALAIPMPKYTKPLGCQETALKARERVKSDRQLVKIKWTALMMRRNWLKAEVKGSTLVLTAYPGSHNSFTRKVDLRKRNPGSYEPNHHPNWDKVPLHVDFDEENCMLAIGPEKDSDDRDHIPVFKVLWED